MVRVHFGPPLQRNGPKQGSWSTAKKRLSGLERRLLASLGTRKAALGKCPVDTCNRRGSPAGERVHFGPPLQQKEIEKEID